MPLPSTTGHDQRGLGLPLAISVLLLLAVVAAGVTRWTGVAHEDVAAEVTSLRAEAAARSGLEWGRVRVVAADACPAGAAPAPQGGNGCEVILDCQPVSVVGGGQNFVLEAIGRCPLTGTIDVERTLRMRIREVP